MSTREAVVIAKTGNSSLKPGQFAWLDCEEAVLQVTKGSVDIYAVKNYGDLKQEKVFLFEVANGKTLFGLPPEETSELKFMISAPKGAMLRAMTRSGILKSAAESGEHILEALWFMIEGWLEELMSALVSCAVPRTFIPLKISETITVKKNQAVRPFKYLTWARLEKGSICSGPMPEHKLEQGALFPLISSGWLKTEEESVLTGLSTEQVFPALLIDNPEVFWQPLLNCHKLAGEFVNRYFILNATKNKERLSEKQIQQNKLIKGAAVHLLKSQMPNLPAAAGSDTVSPMVAIVKIIAEYLGIAEEQVRLPSGMDTKREDILMLKNIAKLANMQIRQVKLERNWQFRDIGPFFGRFGQEETSAAFIPLTPSKYLMYTPDGLCREVTSQIASQVWEAAYVFYAALSETNVSGFNCLKFIFKKCWRSDIGTLLLTSLAAGLIALITPLVTQTIFDDIIPIGDRQGHLTVVQVMVVSAFSSAGVNFARNVAILRLRTRSLFVAESALWLRLLSLPVRFFREFQSGEIVQRMNGITQISTFLSTSSIAVVFNAAFSFFSLLIMVYYSFKLALAASLVWIVYLFLAGILIWRLVALTHQMTAAAGQTAGRVLQIFNGLSKFRLKKAESQAFYLWTRNFGEQWRHNYNASLKSQYLDVLNVVQPTLMSMLIFGFTMYFMDEAGKDTKLFISQPDFMGFHSALGGFNAAIVGLVQVFISLPHIIPLVKRLKPLLETEPEANVNKAEPGDLSGKIEINNISFRYSADRPLVLRNVSIFVHPGQLLAVVGASGSGKSTLLRLLLGFEKAENGSVYYDGQDISELNLNSVRSQMGVVLQNGQIMSGDIFSNIVGSLPLTLDDAWEAAEMVGIAEDIRRMPMGMNTVISEGATNISVGQRQRILIARAIVHRPRIIFFDEATSALDNRTQAIVTESIARLKATRIVIAHRLSTIIGADIIYVLDKGQVAESGTYEELMDKNGHFVALAKRQMI